MHRKEINKRSPLRVLEKSIHGGLGRGNVGVIVARHGVGKTAFLVGIALDDLMRGRNVLHVSLGHDMDKVIAFYDDIYLDLARTLELEDVWQARRDLESHRRISCYRPDEFSMRKLRGAVEFWHDQGFYPAAIVVEGFSFEHATAEILKELRQVAGEANAEVWMSAVRTREAEVDSRGIPEPLTPLEPQLDVILSMAHDGKGVHISLLKDHDSPEVSDLKLALDPTTLLLVQE